MQALCFLLIPVLGDQALYSLLIPVLGGQAQCFIPLLRDYWDAGPKYINSWECRAKGHELLGI